MINTFINNFKKSNPQAIEKAFTEGNCYWFAKILEVRFGGVILYNPVEGHFVWGHPEYGIYDITGRIHINDVCIQWELFKRIEPIEAARIIKQCVNLEGIE